MKRFRFGAQFMWCTSRREWLDFARHVEDLGYSTLLMPDHFPLDLATVPALTMAAAVTTTLKVGSMVFDNDFRHPLLLAKEAATIHLLTDGRFECGVGAGWNQEEYSMAGIPFDSPKVRVDRLEEALPLMVKAWSGETFSHQGRFYQVQDYQGAPVCRPPLVVGGGGPRMLRLAARHADIVSILFKLSQGGMGPGQVPDSSLEAVRRQVDLVREAAGDRFEELELSLPVFWARLTDTPRDDIAENAAGVGYTPEQAMASMHFLYGSEDGVVEELERRRELLGVNYFVFSQFGSDLVDLARVVRRLAA